MAQFLAVVYFLSEISYLLLVATNLGRHFVFFIHMNSLPMNHNYKQKLLQLII